MAMLVSSCKKDETIRYNNITMGNVDAATGMFHSDQGNIFYVAEQNCTGRLDTMKRAIILCDVLSRVEGKDNEYNIRLNQIGNVLEKDVVTIDDRIEIETYINNPILISDVWFSGGYINFHFSFPVDKAKNKSHYINMLYNEGESGNGEYKFIIRHDAQGDALAEDKDNSHLTVAYAYASFPIQERIIKENNAKIILEWNDYIVINGTITPHSITREIDFLYRKSDYQQIPNTVVNGKNLRTNLQ